MPSKTRARQLFPDDKGSEGSQMGEKTRHFWRILPPGDVTDLSDTSLTVKLSSSLALTKLGIKKKKDGREAPALPQEEPTLCSRRSGAFSVRQ